MTRIKLAIIEATLTDRTWSCADDATREMLQSANDALAIHGGTPDVEQAIVLALAERFPLTILRAQEIEAGEDEGVIF